MSTERTPGDEKADDNGADPAGPASTATGGADAGKDSDNQRSGKSGVPGLLLGALALIIALAALAGTYLTSQRNSETRHALDETRAVLEAKISELPPALSRLESRVGGLGDEVAALAPKLESGLQGELDAFDTRLAALHQLLQKTAAPVHEPADVEHLMLIANDSLNLQYDIPTALAALQTADERLRTLGDPAFSETRRRLAREISALQATARPDVAGAAFAISGLQQELESLTLESLRSPAGERRAPSLADAPGEVGEAAEPDSGWREILRDLWTTLGSLVVIRRSDELEGPLIGPEQRIFLNQNLRLKLESARLALLTRDVDNFRHHLDIAIDWLSRYYDDRDQKVAAMLERLAELKELDIDPALPDISGSLQALREALERRRTPILDDAGANPAGQSS